MNELHKLLKKIAMRLDGIHKYDLTTAERQIVQLLLEAEYVKFTNNGEVESC